MRRYRRQTAGFQNNTPNEKGWIVRSHDLNRLLDEPALSGPWLKTPRRYVFAHAWGQVFLLAFVIKTDGMGMYAGKTNDLTPLALLHEAQRCSICAAIQNTIDITDKSEAAYATFPVDTV